MPIYRFKEDLPQLHESVYVAPNATLIGRVSMGQKSSVWFGSVLRGDTDSIIIGEETNIQDLTMCHADAGFPLTIGDHVTVGHNCVVHGCTIHDHCLIGMGAVVMNGAEVGQGSIVAAGTVVLENTKIPPFSLVAGIPGKVKKTFENQEEMIEVIGMPARIYMEKRHEYGSEATFARLPDFSGSR